ncbi:Uncharacterised protein [Serratia quinivorans]|nr:Uncharacterised protein [Serratia quinivorans]
MRFGFCYTSIREVACNSSLLVFRLAQSCRINGLRILASGSMPNSVLSPVCRGCVFDQTKCHSQWCAPLQGGENVVNNQRMAGADQLNLMWATNRNAINLAVFPGRRINSQLCFVTVIKPIIIFVHYIRDSNNLKGR